MAHMSTIRRLPAELREMIARLRQNGLTIDEIMAKLHELDVGVSRSALGRHIKLLDEATGGDLGMAREIAGLRRDINRLSAALRRHLDASPRDRV
jgi:DNA-binding transcriptional ArsR family regulator